MRNRATVREFDCIRDKLRIWGRCYLPENINAEPLPAVIISHPFMVTATYVEHYARMLAELGYAAFIFDFCGGSVSSRSDGRTTDMTVFTETDDLLAVLDYVRSMDMIDNGNIFLMGCSQGGFVSAIAARRLQDEIRGLVMFYPALCIPEYTRQGNLIGSRFDPRNIPDVVSTWGMRLGREYIESVMDLDVNEYISAYRGPGTDHPWQP